MCADFGGGAWLWDTHAADAGPRGLHPSLLCRAAFSPDSHWLVLACFDAVRFLELDTGRPGLRLARDSASDLPGLAAFLPDGGLLACTPQLRSVRLADARTGAELAALNAPDLRMLTDLFFSGDGRVLGALTVDGTVPLWNLAELRGRLAASGLDWAPESIAAPSRGTRRATGSEPLPFPSRTTARGWPGRVWWPLPFGGGGWRTEPTQSTLPFPLPGKAGRPKLGLGWCNRHRPFP